MHCNNCGFDNPNGMKFCGQCGQPLKRQCPGCGFDNPANFNFCGQCGTALELSIENEEFSNHSTSQTPQTLPIHEAERRQLTVMFCDLVGSTSLSEQLDPEDFREVVRAYQQTAAQVIGRFEGTIAQYLGDGLLVYFGFPVAHENDAHRAALSGLGIIEEMKNLNVRLQQSIRTRSRGPLRLAVRIGIHTGLVVIGEIGSGARREQLAVGETTNIAARLQNLAKPNTVVISVSTYRLVEGFFACRPLGFQSLKGITRPLEIYRVLRQSRARNRLDAAKAAMTGLTPLVGREEEMRLLSARWEQAKEGKGQVLLLSGEAGIGKSRLIRVFREQLTGEPHLWLSCHCSPYYQNTALYPFVDLLQRLLRFKEHDSPGRKLQKLETALDQYDLPRTETAPLFTPLLALPLSERYPSLNLSPQRQKQNLLKTLLIILLKLTEVRPVVIFIEDLHWGDPSTLEILSTLVDQVSNARVFVLFTFRPNFEAAWPVRSYLTHLSLTRLVRRQAEALVESVAAGKKLPSELLEQIIAKTDGVPIFLEELTKMVLEQDLLRERADRYELVGPLPALAIPATLHDSLMARLDRLAAVREVAQLGATLGRSFSYRLLQAVAAIDEPSLQYKLTQLVDAELLYQQGLPPDAAYSFKHALIQETAYRSLLRAKRQQVHQRIAQVLVDQFPEYEQTEPEVIAHHYTAAGQNEAAVRFWYKAGQRAVAQSANREAINHFTQALNLLEFLPPSPERRQQELHLRIALGAPLLMTKGYVAPEVETNYARARELCQQLDQSPQLASVLFGLWVFYLVKGQFQTAVELGEQLAELARQTQDAALWLEAHRMQGMNYFNLGQLNLARTHLEEAVAIYNPHQHGPQVFIDAGADRGVACLSYLAITLWLLGFPDQALKRSQEAIALAAQLAHPYSQAFALCWSAWLHQLRREPGPAQALAHAGLEVATEQDFELLEMLCAMMESWALTEQDQTEVGLEGILHKLREFQATGAQLGQLHFWVLLAEVYSRTDRFDEGLSLVTQALAELDHKGEQFYAAELYRLRGEMLLVHQTEPDPYPDAEACFQQAVDLAHQQDIRSLQLRATISLARLQVRQGRTDEAETTVTAIYRQFTEGFDTIDLQAAGNLISNSGSD
ncbi:MAG: AAA family ATPase [Anaerolineaceae bacterium]|nr:AAA family ATPase [Anaerolineaceae bacterium]MCB9101053.1 AAA family ATPase [Anaerolineales bacterium]